ncbi:MAG TPA: hypothetical protein VF171_09590, partial [Trueperaceae bacterium]
MNIAMISGHYPPEPCGVGDYTAKLCDALRDQGLAVTHLHNKLRSPADVRRLYGRLREQPCDLVHLQYPSGYGRSLLPHLLSLRHGWLVTLHEMSEAHRLRRLAALLFAARARHLVFTTELERELACRRFPSLAGRSSAIPIASNIPAPTSPKQDEFVHFGLIRPKKGIEEFLAFVRAAQKDAAFGRYRFRIVGGVRDNQRPYLDTLQRAAAGLPITWSLNLTEREVAEVLSRARLGYLPFPDGLSERRGS